MQLGAFQTPCTFACHMHMTTSWSGPSRTHTPPHPCRPAQFQGRAVFRHDLSMPLEPLLATYCKWRGIELGRASFLWLQFYMRLGLHDTGVSRGMDDGDTIYIYDKQDSQGRLWDAVLDGDPQAVGVALDGGSSLSGPEGSFEAITCRCVRTAELQEQGEGMRGEERRSRGRGAARRGGGQCLWGGEDIRLGY